MYKSYGCTSVFNKIVEHLSLSLRLYCLYVVVLLTFSLNVQCGIIGTTIIEPYFFHGYLNGNKYLEFL